MIDEIKAFVESQNVLACEAYWRLFGFSIHGEEPLVQNLAVHLPNQQMVYTIEAVDQEQAQRAAESHEVTTLLAWFNLNQTDPRAHRYKYNEIPFQDTWSKKD